MEVFSENDGEVRRRGLVTLSGVEFHTGGQYNTENSMIRMRNVGGITITKSSFIDCHAGCIDAEGVSSSNFI